MHDPTTQTRPIAGAALITASSVPGTPIASNTTGVRRPSAGEPRFHRIVDRGIDRDVAPIASATARRRGEKSETTIGLDARRGRSSATTASPTGPGAEHDRGFGGRDRGARRPRADRPTSAR